MLVACLERAYSVQKEFTGHAGDYYVMYTLRRLKKYAKNEIPNHGVQMLHYEVCTGCAWVVHFLHFMSYLTLVDTMLKLTKFNRIDILEISGSA